MFKFCSRREREDTADRTLVLVEIFCGYAEFVTKDGICGYAEFETEDDICENPTENDICEYPTFATEDDTGRMLFLDSPDVALSVLVTAMNDGVEFHVVVINKLFIKHWPFHAIAIQSYTKLFDISQVEVVNDVPRVPRPLKALFCNFKEIKPVGTFGTVPDKELRLTSNVLTLLKAGKVPVKELLLAINAVKDEGKDGRLPENEF